MILGQAITPHIKQIVPAIKKILIEFHYGSELGFIKNTINKVPKARDRVGKDI